MQEPAGKRARDAAQDGIDGIQSMLEYKLPGIGGLSIDVGQILGALLVILLTWVATIVIRRALAKYGERHPNTSPASLYTVTRLVQYVVLVIGVLIALKAIGVSLGQFAVVAGALGVGLGFGLQAIFSNFLSGLILLFDKSLKVGDFVELESGVHGEVQDIKIRATTIVTNDNIDILVPNAEFVTGRVVNWTHRETSRRAHIPFGVAYGADKEVVKRAALEAAAEVPFTLAQDGPRRPKVWLTEFGDSSLNFELVVWLTAEATKRPSAVKAAYNWALHTALQKYDIEIPFPQRDLNIRSLFGHEGDQALARLRGEKPEKNKGDAKSAPAEKSQANKQERRDVESSAEEPSANDAVEEVREQAALEAEREAEREAEKAQAQAKLDPDRNPDRDSEGDAPPKS